MDGQAPSKIDLRHSETKVVFSFTECSLDKKYSFHTLENEEAKHLMAKLRHIEKMTWSQFSNLPREKGLTVENPDSESWDMIHQQNTCESKFLEQYYFHFRVHDSSLFRVFGYQKGMLFCITHLDSKGKIHH